MGHTKEEIQNANVGEATTINSTILLENYNENWPLEYENQKTKILSALSHFEVSVEHVGSTSVPGLCAKPIIDIVLEVLDSSNEADYVPHLEFIDFKLKIREPDWFQHRMLKGLLVPVNLHVFTAGCSEVQRMIKFRDHLRSNEKDRELYQAKKTELAAKQWEYVQNYADAKTEIIKEIMGE